jgi:hypothetical protein
MLTMKQANVKTSSERLASHVKRLQAAGGKRTTLDLTAESIDHINLIRLRSSTKGSNREVILTALERWAKSFK